MIVKYYLMDMKLFLLDEAYAINKAPLEGVYPTREKAPTQMKLK